MSTPDNGEKKGQALNVILVEYVLILLLMALVCIAFVSSAGKQVNAAWSKVNGGLTPQGEQERTTDIKK